MEEIKYMTTESVNEKSANIDEMTSLELVKLINSEDKTVAFAVEKQLENIAKVANLATEALKKGGRIIYIGAGTSGRLGVVDASECPPTFSVSPDKVIGLIAGGKEAMFRSIESAEDSETLAKQELMNISLNKNDVLIGIAASGRTPYVLYALKYAREIGVKTACIVCNKGSVIAKNSDVAIEVVVGPEVLTGSTRMKSGTAQKFVLNMISTISMINIGKTYKNYMVDLCQSNQKLERRALNMVMEIASCDEVVAKDYLKKADGSVKLAITALLANASVEEAKKALDSCGGKVKKAIEKL